MQAGAKHLLRLLRLAMRVKRLNFRQARPRLKQVKRVPQPVPPLDRVRKRLQQIRAQPFNVRQLVPPQVRKTKPQKVQDRQPPVLTPRHKQVIKPARLVPPQKPARQPPPMPHYPQRAPPTDPRLHPPPQDVPQEDYNQPFTFRLLFVSGRQTFIPNSGRLLEQTPKSLPETTSLPTRPSELARQTSPPSSKAEQATSGLAAPAKATTGATAASPAAEAVSPATMRRRLSASTGQHGDKTAGIAGTALSTERDRCQP